MDSLDAAIIELLKIDARMGYVDIGARVDLSPDSVRQRMVRLIDAQEVRIFGVIEPEALGYRVLANVVLQYRGDPERFAEAMRRHPCVSYLSETIGRTNLLCEIAAESDAMLTDFVSREIATVEEVETFEVSRTIEVKKWEGLSSVKSAPLPDPEEFGQLDDIDVTALRVLLHDPRIKLTQLSEQIGAPYPTVRRRVAALYERGIIQAVAATDRVVSERDPIAVVMLARASSAAWDAGLAALPGVKIASRNIGAYSGLLEMHAKTSRELVDRLDQVGSFPGVKIAETLLLAKTLVIPISWRFRENLAAGSGGVTAPVD